VSALLRRHETVMVDIQMQRHVDQAVFKLRRSAKTSSFEKKCRNLSGYVGGERDGSPPNA